MTRSSGTQMDALDTPMTLEGQLDALLAGSVPSGHADSVVTIDLLDSWTLPAPTSLAPTTICWVGGKSGREPGTVLVDALAAA
jgi:hypothetical protein